MASTCIDPVLHNLDLLHKNVLAGHDWHKIGFINIRDNLKALELKLQFLRTFMVCASKWRNDSDLCLESNDHEKVTLHSLLSSIEDEVTKYGPEIHPLCLRKETEAVRLKEVGSAVETVVSDFHETIKSFKQGIIKAYIALSDCSSSQSTACMRDDELVDFMDILVQNLMDLLRRMVFCTEIPFQFDNALHAQVEVLEHELTFLKNFVRFAKLQGVENCQLGDLILHTEIIALDAARLSYLCSWYKDDEEVRNPEMRSSISELTQMMKAVDSRISKIYINVLRASKSSALTNVVSGMDKQIISNFNDWLISCLWELLWCNSSLAGSMKDQIKLLYDGLRFLRTIQREQLKMDNLNEDIRAVIADAGVIIFSLSKHQMQRGDVDSMQVEHDLVNINIDIKLIGAQNIHPGAAFLGSLPSDYNIIQQVENKTSSLIRSKSKTPRIHEAMVDLHDEVQTVKDRLASGSNRMEIVSIVGMPGLGKTTLAKTVISNPSIKYHFHIILWCCVSQSYNKKNVLLQILGDEGKYSSMNEPLKQMDENDLALNLYQKLKKNKYLVVLDDVWDIAVWNDFRMSFPNDDNGSRILITSRFSNVASQVGKPHNLRSLTSTESWELLEKKVFGEEDCPEELHKLGTEIAKNCKGLPLTIVIIAGILANVGHDVWEEVAKSLTSSIVYEMDQYCKNTVEVSYKHLPNYLRPCLLYFGAFPEDQEIRIQELMWLWMGEGFVQNTESKRLEDVAEEYLAVLIGRNLVMVTKQRSIGGAKACSIHDLIREFCKAKAKEEKFLQVLRGYDELSVFIEPSNLERLSICSSPEAFNKSRLFCPNAHSLLFFNHIKEYQTIADISFIFCIYKQLRVLNIEQIVLMDKNFPSEIASLGQLRFLAVRGYLMISMPPSIANLLNFKLSF